MSTVSVDNNTRLRALIEGAQLTQIEALELFNRGVIKPYKISTWKAFLADPESVRYRRFDDALMKHAEKVFGKLQKA